MMITTVVKDALVCLLWNIIKIDTVDEIFNFGIVMLSRDCFLYYKVMGTVSNVYLQIQHCLKQKACLSRSCTCTTP